MKDTSVPRYDRPVRIHPWIPNKYNNIKTGIRLQNIMYDDIDIGHNWSEEALNRLFDDIKNDPNTKISYTQ